MNIGFIGAGKVGFSLGKLLADNNIPVTGYYSRHEGSAKEAAEFTNTKLYNTLEDIVKDNDMLFLTVPDGQITTVYKELVSYDIHNKIICHCSGALSSKEAFPDIEEYDAEGYSVHPLFPVSNKYTSYKELQDAFFCLEGEGKNKENVSNRLLSMNIKLLNLDTSNKVKYHLACAVASNLVCALLDQSIELFTECGFKEQEARAALAPLIESNIKHVIGEGTKSALTGPIERGDYKTVKKHVDCLKERDKQLDLDLYVSASKRCLMLAGNKNPDRDYKDINNVLENN